jgi:hypothetical protein
MAFDFAAAKKTARQTVMDTLGMDAFYTDPANITPVAIRARWHTKIDRFGDNGNLGYAEVIEGVSRLILTKAQAREIGVQRGGVVTFPQLDGVSVTLEEREPKEGPIEEVWTVSTA